MNITHQFTIAATVIAMTIGTAAQAQEAKSIDITVAGADLSHPAAVSQLESRIKTAAKQVCGVGQGRELAEQAKERQCYNEAVASASMQMQQQIARSESRHSDVSLAVSDRPEK